MKVRQSVARSLGRSVDAHTQPNQSINQCLAAPIHHTTQHTHTHMHTYPPPVPRQVERPARAHPVHARPCRGLRILRARPRTIVPLLRLLWVDGMGWVGWCVCVGMQQSQRGGAGVPHHRHTHACDATHPHEFEPGEEARHDDDVAAAPAAGWYVRWCSGAAVVTGMSDAADGAPIAHASLR